MRRFPLFFFLNIWMINVASAQIITEGFFKLEDSLKKGHKTALYTLANYMHDTTSYVEHYIDGNWETTVGEKSKSVVKKNSLFLPNEFDWEDSTADFSAFLSAHDSSIAFDAVTEKFLITPVTKRVFEYKLYEYNFPDKLSIDSLLKSIEEDTEMDFQDLRNLLRKKDSYALFLLASKSYISDNYVYGSLHRNTFEKLFAMLVNLLVSVKNEDDQWIWTYNQDYFGAARLNQLIYWANHYSDYKWDEVEGRFVNQKASVAKKPAEVDLLTAMHSEDDSVAIKAFVKMTHYDTSKVDDAPILDFKDEMNDALPIFQDRFLQVLSRYTAYCSQNKLSLQLRGRTKFWFDQLAKGDLPFKQRYQLENEVIDRARVDEISALEYWFLVSEENWDLTFSAGRIIDKFYSFHWNEIIHDTAQLKHYLKKAALFDRLGIIGNCNKYMKKFQFIDDRARANLSLIGSTAKDRDLANNVTIARKGVKIIYEPITRKIWDANRDTLVTDLSKQYKKFMKKPHEDYENPLHELTALINYSQIAGFISLVRKEKRFDEVYDFLEGDFGIPVDVEDSIQVEEFLVLYKKLSHENLCRHYLHHLGINYKKPDGSLDYQAIYEMLEFDIVDALSGGGGGHRETGVYLLIKLLEFKFKTTLGFPKKLCNGEGIYGCSSDDRAREWINYLLTKKLAKPFTGMPLSISPLGR